MLRKRIDDNARIQMNGVQDLVNDLNVLELISSVYLYPFHMLYVTTSYQMCNFSIFLWQSTYQEDMDERYKNCYWCTIPMTPTFSEDGIDFHFQLTVMKLHCISSSHSGCTKIKAKKRTQSSKTQKTAMIKYYQKWQPYLTFKKLLTKLKLCNYISLKKLSRI